MTDYKMIFHIIEILFSLLIVIIGFFIQRTIKIIEDKSKQHDLDINALKNLESKAEKDISFLEQKGKEYESSIAHLKSKENKVETDIALLIQRIEIYEKYNSQSFERLEKTLKEIHILVSSNNDDRAAKRHNDYNK